MKNEKIRIYHFLILAAIIFSILAILYLRGIFVPKVKVTAYATGEFNKSNDVEYDYDLWVTYSSKGAFVANENIHVKVKLKNNNHTLDGKLFRICFKGAYPSEFLNLRENEIYSIIDAMVEFKNISEEELITETDLIYFIPGEHVFSIEIDKKNQKEVLTDAYMYLVREGVLGAQLPRLNEGEYLIKKRDMLHVAPLEESLQIQSNNIQSTLALAVLSLTFVELAYIVYIKK